MNTPTKRRKRAQRMRTSKRHRRRGRQTPTCSAPCPLPSILRSIDKKEDGGTEGLTLRPPPFPVADRRPDAPKFGRTPGRLPRDRSQMGGAPPPADDTHRRECPQHGGGRLG